MSQREIRPVRSRCDEADGKGSLRRGSALYLECVRESGFPQTPGQSHILTLGDNDKGDKGLERKKTFKFSSLGADSSFVPGRGISLLAIGKPALPCLILRTGRCRGPLEHVFDHRFGLPRVGLHCAVQCRVLQQAIDCL